MFERRKPPRNAMFRKGLLGGAVFAARRFLDLQMSSVVTDVRPWLATRGGELLEVGCGDQPYRCFFAEGIAYTGLDWDGAKTGFESASDDVVYYDGTLFPLADKTFDAVFHTEVLEHVINVPLFLSECHRVLRPGGEMMLTVPFQARFHFIPHDYWRFTPSGLEHVLREAGFVNIKVTARGTDLCVAAYKVVAVFYRMAYDGLIGKLLLLLLSWLVGLLLLSAHISLRYKLGSQDDCIGYTVTASRPFAF